MARAFLAPFRKTDVDTGQLKAAVLPGFAYALMSLHVMPGLVPGIHALEPSMWQGVDGRDKPGHDAVRRPPERVG